MTMMEGECNASGPRSMDHRLTHHQWLAPSLLQPLQPPIELLATFGIVFPPLESTLCLTESGERAGDADATLGIDTSSKRSNQARADDQVVKEAMQMSDLRGVRG